MGGGEGYPVITAAGFFAKVPVKHNSVIFILKLQYGRKFGVTFIYEFV